MNFRIEDLKFDEYGLIPAIVQDAHTREVLTLPYMNRDKRERPEGSYTTYLFNEGLDKILKKLGEESAETIIAAKNEDTTALVAEVSDLIYHLLVLLVERGISLHEIRQELAQRRNRQAAAERK